MAKYNRPNGKLFGSSASNIGVFGSGQTGETPTTSTDPNAINTLGTHWEDGWNGAVVSQAPYTAPYVEDMNAVNYVNSYNSAYLLQRGIPEYSATEEYQKDSLCTYNSEIWMCKLDNTVGQTPAEGTYWHLQGEVPIMNDNEILVGAVGGTPTVVDTNGQGDIVASATGLNIKSGVIVNADVKSDAGIDESKLALDYSTSALEGTISGHISDSSNPHSVTKSQVLSGDLIVNIDVDDSAGIKESKLDLDYATDTLNTNIGNVANDLSTHTGNKNNPHETKISNLNDVTITNLQDGDVILYSLADDKYINQQPPGGALSTLSDTTITSPTDKQLVQYDYANNKWVNSSDVWNTIEINDIANINNASANVTLTISDKRHQIFTSTTGFDVALPSTDIKAGEKFVFDFPRSVDYFSTPYSFSCGGTNICYSHNGYFTYVFTAKTSNPTSSDYRIDTYPTRLLVKTGYFSHVMTATNGTRVYDPSNVLFTLGKGIYDVTFQWAIDKGNARPGDTYSWASYVKCNNNLLYEEGSYNYIGTSYVTTAPFTKFNSQITVNGTNYGSRYLPTANARAITSLSSTTNDIKVEVSLYNVSGSNDGVTNSVFTSFKLIAPVIIA